MDYSSKAGCEELVKKIKQFWKDKGKDIQCWCQLAGDKIYENNRNRFYEVRSNLINGLPK